MEPGTMSSSRVKKFVFQVFLVLKIQLKSSKLIVLQKEFDPLLICSPFETICSFNFLTRLSQNKKNEHFIILNQILFMGIGCGRHFGRRSSKGCECSSALRETLAGRFQNPVSSRLQMEQGCFSFINKRKLNFEIDLNSPCK